MKPKSVHLLIILGVVMSLFLFTRGNAVHSDPDKTPAATKDDKITICHVPPGNTGNPQTITISRSAWRTDGKGEGGHGPGLHGGDYLGPCLTSTMSATGTATTIAAVTPPDTGPACMDWVYYHSDRTGNLNIFRLVALPDKPTASADVSMGTGSGVQDMSPARSPDGKFLAFTSNRDGNWEIYIGAADGSSQSRVTHTTAANLSPMWSPDGKSITYETNRNGSNDIYMVDVVSRQETQLTSGAANKVNPFWSPDSQKILIQTDQDKLWQIYELTVSSKALKRLSDGQSNDINPQYSPDGTQIVFRSYSLGSLNTAIYTMNADGSNRQPISDPKGSAVNPVWSPDNTLIAYQSNLTGTSDIYVYQVSTKQTRKVTDSTTQNSAPTWHCNAPILVYTSVSNGKPQLYQVPALPIDAKSISAADTTQLTNDAASNQNPQDSPAVEDASHRVQEGSPQ